MKRTKNRLNPQPKPIPVAVGYGLFGEPVIWNGFKYRPLLDHEQAMIRRELTGVNERPCGKP